MMMPSSRHPPHLMRSASSSVLLHLVSTATTFQTIREVLRSDKPHISDSFGSHFQYLTIDSLCISFATFLICLVHSVVAAATPRPWTALDRLRRTLRFIATPLEAVIVMVYWPLYVLRPGALADQRTLPPLRLDVGLHLLPAVFLVLEFLVLRPRRLLTVGSRMAAILFSAILGIYIMWLMECRARNGFWAYPFLERVGNEVRVLIFFAVVGSMCAARKGLLSWALESS